MTGPGPDPRALRYQALKAKTAELQGRLAFWREREKERAARQRELTEKLKAAGIDTDHLPEEQARLEREADAILEKVETEVAECERQLNEALAQTGEKSNNAINFNGTPKQTNAPDPIPGKLVLDDELNLD